MKKPKPDEVKAVMEFFAGKLDFVVKSSQAWVSLTIIDGKIMSVRDLKK